MHTGFALADASGSGVGNLLILALPLVLLFFLMLSQRRRSRAVQDLQRGLSVGDEVVMTSGLYGRITALHDAAVSLQIAPGVVVTCDRRAIGIRRTAATGDDAPSDAPDDESAGER